MLNFWNFDLALGFHPTSLTFGRDSVFFFCGASMAQVVIFDCSIAGIQPETKDVRGGFTPPMAALIAGFTAG